MSTRLLPRVAAVIGALVIAAIIAGVTFARTGLDNTYTGCLNNGGEIKRVAIGSAPIGHCSPNEQQISWNESGPAGPPGPPGPPGSPGVLGFYRVTDSFACPSPGPGCPALSYEAPLAECLAGDLATGGAAYRTGIDIPVQDHPARPSTLTGDPVTGFTILAFTLQAGDVLNVVAICADLP